MLPFVCYYNRKDTPENTQKAHDLSVKSGIEYIVSYPYTLTPTEPAKYAFKEATQQRITALSIEAGKLGTVQKDNVNLIKTAVYSMLEHSGNYVTRKSKSDNKKRTALLNQQDYIRVPENGIFYSDLKSGDKIKKNQILGYITDEFGNKKHEHTFLELVKELDQVNAIERIRISSIEPNLLKDETIEFVSTSNRFVPHFHIPLQSGSDEILKKMKRRYLSNLYLNRVTKIREVMPNACIGVDVIVGFPGETEELFMETYNFLNELPISYLHVFTYSERDNTEAIEYDGVVNQGERKNRNKMLRILSEKKRQAFYQSQLGTTQKVLWEHENKNEKMFGFTENYVKVQTDYHPELVNQTQLVDLVRINHNGIVEVKVHELELVN